MLAIRHHQCTGVRTKAPSRLAIAGWRRRSVPRSAAVLFALAALLSLWPPLPPGMIVASLAIVITAWTAEQPRET
ncbi:hypothetical protein [Spirillospora sp. NPDC048824]|uniref:hypothetical protein n=1 Tax=Spirillospora sp. NPDC048824 TaxID=3364526 RepID=UPI00371552DD